MSLNDVQTRTGGNGSARTAADLIFADGFE